MDVKKIYFDMDGVLADFDRGVKEMCGITPPPPNTRHLPGGDAEMWAGIRKIEHFYDKLPPMPDAIDLFNMVYERYKDRCEILSGIPKPDKQIYTAGEDKENWVRRLLSEDIKVNIVFKEEKPRYCTGKDCILIDDMKSNISKWQEYGGTGILHISCKDTLNILKELCIL